MGRGFTGPRDADWIRPTAGGIRAVGDIATESHLRRYREIARVLAEEGLGAVAVRLKLPEAVRKVQARAPDATTPQRMRRALERIGPSGVKLGQMLSTRADLIPPMYRAELRRLQDEVAPVSYDEVTHVITQEFGAGPGEVFALFSREPLAAASIGQVHAAMLPTGEEVVVKVQRPGILSTLELDLDIAVVQAKRLESAGLAPEGLNVVSIAREFARAVRSELDYLSEADNVERFGRAFDGSFDVAVPRVFRRYTTSKVITLERLHGIPFNRPDLIADFGFDRHDLAERGTRAYLEQIFGMGAFHADPHPGNIFALVDGRIGFTDFGRVGTVPQGLRDAAADLLLAMVDRDADLAADALMTVSADPGGMDFERLRRGLTMLIGKYHGAELGTLRAGELIDDLLDLVRRERLCLPSEFALMLTTLAILEGVGTELDPEFDFVEVARPYSERLVREQFEPGHIAQVAFRTVRRFARAGMDLPSSAERALRRVAEGQFHIGVRLEGYQSLLDRAEELVDRLSFAVLIAAFVVGFSTLLSVRWLPLWLEVVLLLGMLAAIIVSVWMFASLMIARVRGRHGAA